MVARRESGGCQERQRATPGELRMWLRFGTLRPGPGHLEFAATPLARHAARAPADGLACVATRAHGVTVTPMQWDAHRVARPGHDAPLARRAVDHLEERGRDLERAAATYFDHRLQGIEPRDARPPPPPPPQIQAGPQPRPLSFHAPPPVRLPGAARGARDRRAHAPPPPPYRPLCCSPQ